MRMIDLRKSIGVKKALFPDGQPHIDADSEVEILGLDGHSATLTPAGQKNAL